MKWEAEEEKKRKYINESNQKEKMKRRNWRKKKKRKQWKVSISMWKKISKKKKMAESLEKQRGEWKCRRKWNGQSKIIKWNGEETHPEMCRSVSSPLSGRSWKPLKKAWKRKYKEKEGEETMKYQSKWKSMKAMSKKLLNIRSNRRREMLAKKACQLKAKINSALSAKLKKLKKTGERKKKTKARKHHASETRRRENQCRRNIWNNQSKKKMLSVSGENVKIMK